MTWTSLSNSKGLNSTAIFAQSPAIAAEHEMARRETISPLLSMISAIGSNPAAEV
jgi:hypothetical protein